MENPLSGDQLEKIHAYWRAANYLSVGQIYLLDNPLLKAPLTLEHATSSLIHTESADANTSATAPCSICATSCCEPARLSCTLMPGWARSYVCAMSPNA